MRSFFKIIVSDITSESKLIIPRKFVRNHEDKLLERVVLKTPGGAAWAVDVERRNNKVSVRNGWPQFATFYSISFGYNLVVFDYIGQCNLLVHVYDPSTTEINYTNLNNGKLVLQIRKFLFTHCTSVKMTSYHCQLPAIRDGVSESEGEKDIALASANAFKSDKPFFVVSMKPSYVAGRGMNIPRNFQETFTEWKNRNKLILHVAGRNWAVDCILRPDRCRLTSGWIKFIRANSLNVGDVCVFELINSSRKLFEIIPQKFARKYGEELQGRVLLKAPGATTWSVDVERKKGQGNCNFKVVIFDTSATEIDYPLKLEKQVHSCCNKVCHAGDSLKRKLQKEKIAEASSDIETSSSDEDLSDAIGTRRDADRMRKFIKLEADLDISMHQQVIRAKGVISRCSESEEENNRAVADARAFKSSHPFFKVLMYPSYVGRKYSLQVKKDFLKSYIGKGVVEVLLLRVGAKTWPVKCSVYSKRVSLSWGWKEFAKDNAIAVGDVCVFELVKPSKKLINVVIFRATSSTGVHQQ
ncbi:B3 domain-containing protein LOC_Os12g40080-like [Apium graveolens]|uniref:B3 domain-containing protein LOC_Os12g40080-like n=1 Tax=Apium graveolens TaxID=4045 RepID=UPI003D7981FC